MIEKETKEELEEFNWNNSEIYISDDEIKEIESRVGISSLFFRIFEKICSFVFIILIFLRALWYLFNLYSIFDNNLKINFMIESGLLISGIFLFISLIFNIILFVFKKTKLFYTIDYYITVIKLFVVILWLLTSYYLIDFIFIDSMKSFNLIMKRCIEIAILFTVILMFFSLLIKKLKLLFIKKSLTNKMKYVENTEKILKRIQSFNKSSTLITHSNDSIVNISRLESSKSFDLINESEEGMLLKKPTLNNINEAINLAKDVFKKLSTNNIDINFESFSKIFEDKQEALVAFDYFDYSNDQLVHKKEFRDTIINFYQERLILTKSLKSVKSFCNVIVRLIYVIILFISFLLSLIILKVSITKFLSVLASSGFVIHIFGANMIDKIVKSILLLISHPYDIGDEVIVSNEELKVFKMGLLSTSFINIEGHILKFNNSDLLNNKIFNMTKAPEKILIFNFSLPSEIPNSKLIQLKNKIYDFLKENFFDYHDTFKIVNEEKTGSSIKNIRASIVLKCKGYKNKPKRFMLRAAFISYLSQICQNLKISLDH
ncbi:MSL10 [Hepatospora eriocheir]|uniref:MSL10 n=1 Tax=Hepatospora eriocheir TaxID=1081669 RepID=A0A1X0QG39_9MICR|nr:MSL10 [Hepatospora eriocheir]